MSDILERKRIAKLQYELELLMIDRYDLQINPIVQSTDPTMNLYNKVMRENILEFIGVNIKKLGIEIEFAKMKLSKI